MGEGGLGVNPLPCRETAVEDVTETVVATVGVHLAGMRVLLMFGKMRVGAAENVCCLVTGNTRGGATPKPDRCWFVATVLMGETRVVMYDATFSVCRPRPSAIFCRLRAGSLC